MVVIAKPLKGPLPHKVTITPEDDRNTILHSEKGVFKKCIKTTNIGQPVYLFRNGPEVVIYWQVSIDRDPSCLKGIKTQTFVHQESDIICIQ